MNNAIILDNLRSVVVLLIDEEHWCKRALVRDQDNNQLFDPLDENAWKWCILGALHALNCSPDTQTYLLHCAKLYGWSDLDRLNDMNEHYYVIQFLQSALHGIGGWVLLKKPFEYILKKKEPKQ